MITDLVSKFANFLASFTVYGKNHSVETYYTKIWPNIWKWILFSECNHWSLGSESLTPKAPMPGVSRKGSQMVEVGGNLIWLTGGHDPSGHSGVKYLIIIVLKVS